MRRYKAHEKRASDRRQTPEAGFISHRDEQETVFGTDPLEELSIPDGTQIKEHDLVADGDVLVGGQSAVELGIRGGAVVAGERVTVDGDVEADGDCRLDMWCEVDGNVLVGSDAYLGERVHITGQLIVSGDLDIGDDVDIERGFEANGWIVIRNPMPTIVFLFVYLSHLLRVGGKEAAAEVAEEFLATDRAAEPVVIPRGARVSDDTWRVSTPATIGDDCRLHGNIRATEIEVGDGTEIFGSLRAKGPIRVGRGTVIHGDVTTRDGDVVVGPETQIRGGISCDRCALSEAADVEGTIRAREGITIEEPPADDHTDERGADPNREDGTAAVEAEDEPLEEEIPPAFVPLESGGENPEAESKTETKAESEREPESEAEPEPEPEAGKEPIPEPAVVPIGETDTEWRASGRHLTNGDGSGDRDGDDRDVTAIITDAEE